MALQPLFISGWKQLSAYHYYSLELITEFQKEEIKYATEVADTLGVPLEVCNSTNCENVIRSVLASF